MPELIKDDSSYTLSAQVNYWLSYILDIPTELQTERRLDDGVGEHFAFPVGSWRKLSYQNVDHVLAGKKE